LKQEICTHQRKKVIRSILTVKARNSGIDMILDILIPVPGLIRVRVACLEKIKEPSISML
jgi:hypothetical protein